MAATGEKVTATNTVSDRQDTAGTTTSTSFTATLTGGTTCGRTFVAPASGAVMIYNTTNGYNTGGANFCAPEVRAGGTIGSGTVFFAAGEQYSIVMGATSVTMTVATHVQGLTPGSTYNVRQMFKVSAGTGNFAWKELAVQGCV